MKGVSFICSIICLVLCMSSGVLSDYQVEVQLVQYANPTGRLANGQCCDLANGMFCHTGETCDVRIIFSPRNLDTNMLFGLETKAIGTYANTDLIDFPDCADLETFVTATVSNPLTFLIPSSQWTGSDRLRVTADINDVDIENQVTMFESIGSPLLEITRPSMPSDTFTSDIMLSGGSATLTVRYRVICTPGTCGSDCSQTTGCPTSTWTACADIDPVTTIPPTTAGTSPMNPCFPNPCVNEGTCEPIVPSTFRCICREGFTGVTCAEVATPITSTTGTPGTTQPATMTTGSNTVGDDETTTADSGASVSHYPSQWILNLCIIVVLFRLMWLAFDSH